MLGEGVTMLPEGGVMLPEGGVMLGEGVMMLGGVTQAGKPSFITLPRTGLGKTVIETHCTLYSTLHLSTGMYNVQYSHNIAKCK